MKALKMLWALPNIAVGSVLGFASLTWPHWDDRGVLLFESDRGFRRWHKQKGYAAITFGHVIISGPYPGERLMRHELTHVAQYERWGPFYMLAYVFYWVKLGLEGQDPYLDNPFEREARKAEEVPA